MYKKDSGSAVMFPMLYVEDILFNGNDVSLIQLVNIMAI